MLINAHDSCLLIIDVQEKLVPEIHEARRTIANIRLLIKASKILNIPVICTEHCADKIGQTTTQLMDYIDADSIVSKRHFSACSETDFCARLNELDRKQVIIAGAEAHVCVLQTTLMLKQSGYRPYLVADGTSSRLIQSWELAIARMRQNRVDIVSTEMVFFEWLERADTQAFRELLPSIRDTD